jgi:hypothetical protein
MLLLATILRLVLITALVAALAAFTRPAVARSLACVSFGPIACLTIACLIGCVLFAWPVPAVVPAVACRRLARTAGFAAGCLVASGLTAP